MGEWYTPIAEPITAMAIKIWGYVPNVLAAIIFLIIGLVVSKIVAGFVVRALKLSKLDVASEKSGLAKILQVGEIKATLSEIIGKVFYWLLILMVAVTAAQALKFTAAVGLMSRLIAYIPNVIAAILILAIGVFLASFVGSIISAASKNAGIKKANLLAQIVKTAIIIFAMGISLEQLQVGKGLIRQVVSIALLSIGAGFSIAFGLGCKESVAKWVDDFVKGFK